MNAYTSQIFKHFRDRPDTVFSEVVLEGEINTVLWSDLETQSRKVAACLHMTTDAYASDEQEVILIFLPHGVNLFAAFLGSMLGGYVPSFMPCPSSRQNEALFWQSHQALLDRVRPAAIITTASVETQMHNAGLDIGVAAVVIDTTIETFQLSSRGESYIAPEFIEQLGHVTALLQHSSGTTGLKKGVALSFDAIHKHAVSYGDSLDVRNDDVVVSWLPLYHDMGLIACFVTPAWLAIPTVQLSAFDWLNRPQRLFNLIEQYNGTLCWLPNFAFEHLVNTLTRHATKFDLSSMRAFICCSEPCKATTFDRFMDAFAAASLSPKTLKCCYAMAETVFAVTQVPMSGGIQRLLLDSRYLGPGDQIVEVKSGEYLVEIMDCGSVIDGLKVAIVDEDHHPVSSNTIGEIAISGDFLFSGYFKDLYRTTQRLIDGTYYSNDVGFIHRERLYVLGRTDDLIIVNGRNFFAHQIEAMAGEVPGIKPGRVVALPITDEKVGSDVLIIMAERDTSSTMEETQIIDTLITRIQAEINVVPRAVELIDPGTLIKTSSGKMSRKENRILYQKRQTQVVPKMTC